MARTLRALLVGIDQYAPPVPPLAGCVNDINAFEESLRGRVGTDPETTLELRVLRNEQATHAAVVEAFRSHLGVAGPDDVALFYFAGHGSQERAPEAFWPLEPDRLDETLVCHDSRSPGQFDLADKELSALIEEASARGAHVVVILDCCHSGSGTRGPEDLGVRVRRAPTDDRVRTLADFQLTEAQRARLLAPRSGAAAGTTATAWPAGRHVLLAACRDEQEAAEYFGNGQLRGAFSYFLNETLRQATGPLSYRDLHAQVDARLRTSVRNQAPQLEAGNPADLNADFLGGILRPAEPYYRVARTVAGWRLGGGSVHGVPAVDREHPMELALFPFDAPPEQLRDRSLALGVARVTQVGPVDSGVELDGFEPEPAAAYKAVPLTLPLPRLPVAFEGEAAAVALARAAREHAGPNGQPSLYVCEAHQPADAEFRLLARDGRFAITRPTDARPIVREVDGLDAEAARQAIEQLEHIARWSVAARLANPASSIAPGEVEVAILVEGQEQRGTEVRLEYREHDGAWQAPRFRVRVRNRGPRRLHVGLLDLPESFAISAGLMDSGCLTLDPGQEAWAFRGRDLFASIPDALWDQGVEEFRDLLKVIVSTAEFDVRLMEQPALGRPAATRSVAVATAAPRGTLDLLLSRVVTRDLGAADPHATIDDWMAQTVAFTTVRPLPSALIAGAGGEPSRLAGGVTLAPHEGLRGARVRLAAAATAARGLGNLALPAWLRDDPSVCRPFALATTRGELAPLSVLELTGVTPAAAAAVTPEAPLRIEVDTPLEPGEGILPIAFDGEHFLPLGFARTVGGRTRIQLDRLPTAAASAPGTLPTELRRSLTGSIKIFFQKVACGLTGREFAYPILAAADVADAEQVVSERDPGRIAGRVRDAKRIVLLIHGFTDDTLEMRRGLRRAQAVPGTPIDSRYDLVLTFDYESLNTPIEQIARQLQGRLAEVGLGAGHGRELTVVAHSMGGLVARWWIEREGGREQVRRLILLGTPNAGSPWPGVHDWAITSLAVGLNGLATIAWPAAILGSLVGLLERVDVDLDQMQPGSTFLKELAQAPDPGVPYVLIAGNTALAPPGLIVDTTGMPPVQRLLAKALSKPLPHSVADLLFRDEPNDIAVSTASMASVPAPRTPALEIHPVACDHLSYFRHREGLRALAQALDPG